VAAGAAAPPGPPSRSATRLDPALPPVAPSPREPQGWTPVTQPLAQRRGRGGLAVALVAAALVIAGAAVAVALIATGGSDGGTTVTTDSGGGASGSGGGGSAGGSGGGSTTAAARFSTPRDRGEDYPAAYCKTRAGSLYCWTPNDGFTIEMADGPADRVFDEMANKNHAPGGYPVLAFRKTKRIGDYTCTSRTNEDGGLTCEGPSGYGWRMPRYTGCPDLYGPDGSLGIDLCKG